MEEESGITFGEICHLVKKRIWWILGISVIVALVASLLFGFVINRGKNDYSVTFMVEFPGVSDRQYPDGTTFNHASMVYAAQLEAAKASNESFANIDIDGMSSNGGISISAETTGENNTTVYTGVYTITVSSAYFDSADQASDFLRAVLDQTIATVNAKISGMDFTAGLSGYDSLNSYTAYGDRLAILRRQQDYILERYAAVTGDTQSDSDTTTQTQTTATYGSFRYEGKSISELYAEAQTVSTLLSELEKNYETNRFVYLPEDSNAEGYKDAAEGWAKQIKNNADEMLFYKEQFLNSLMSAGYYEQRVLELEQENRGLEAQIEAIGYTYNQADGTVSEALDADTIRAANTAFGGQVDNMFETIKTNSETAKSALVALFAAESQIVYQQSGVTTIVNTTNIILVAVAALVIAFLIACIVFCAADYPAYKRERDAKRTAAVAAPEEAAEPENKEE